MVKVHIITSIAVEVLLLKLNRTLSKGGKQVLWQQRIQIIPEIAYLHQADGDLSCSDDVWYAYTDIVY